MFILFGFGKRTYKDLGQAETCNCRRCNNMVRYIIKKETTWFTLFFIPVIPYKTRILSICPICNSYYEISKENIKDINFSESNDNSQNNNYEGKNEVQKNYLKQVNEVKYDRDSK